MNPAFRHPKTSGLLAQSGRAFGAKINRVLFNNASDIQIPPEPTTCCMSGCANCVWIEYAQTLSKLLDGNDEKVRDIILNKITDPNLRSFLSMELRNLQQSRADTAPKDTPSDTT